MSENRDAFLQQVDDELSEDELLAVAGGLDCFCAVGGGGTGGDGSCPVLGYNDKTCACVAYGQGDGTTAQDGEGIVDSFARCICPLVGNGNTMEDRQPAPR